MVESLSWKRHDCSYIIITINLILLQSLSYINVVSVVYMSSEPFYWFQIRTFEHDLHNYLQLMLA
jgi:hypothetical protein